MTQTTGEVVQTARKRRALLTLAVAGSLGGLLVACNSDVAARVRKHTYPPTFQYFTKAELQNTMWQLAGLVSQLDHVMRATDSNPDTQEAERILVEMYEVSRALGPGGWPSNHPVVSRNVERFRLDLRAARRALQFEPPSFYLAGSISGACLHCHGDE